MVQRMIAYGLMVALFTLIMVTPSVSLGDFIDPPAFIITFALSWFALATVHGLSFPIKLFKGLFHELSQGEAKSHKKMTKQLGVTFLIAGSLGAMLGLLQNVNAIFDVVDFGVVLQISLMTLFYALLANLFVIIPMYAHYSRVEDQVKNEGVS